MPLLGKQILRSYILDSNDLQDTSAMMDLGIIGRELKFHDHTATTVTKINRLLGIVCKTFMNFNTNVFHYSYEVPIHPVIEYGNII